MNVKQQQAWACALIGAAWFVRLWAAPLFLLGWLVGAACQALSVGFLVAWDALAIDYARRLREPEREDAELFDDDDWEDDEDSDDRLVVSVDGDSPQTVTFGGAYEHGTGFNAAGDRQEKAQ